MGDDMRDEWLKLVLRGQPLSDEEIQAMGDRYHMMADMAIQAVQLGVHNEQPGALSLGVLSLGILRHGHRQTINLLIEQIATQDHRVEGADDDEYDVDIPVDAVIALQQIGGPALPAATEFLRYSTNAAARRDMLDVLGVAGRGSEEAFQYLAAEFAHTAWVNDKSHLAGPLALLHDPRAIPMIVEALRAPSLGDSDAWNLLDALQELGVALYVNRDTRSVSIPDYGIVEDVLPADWKSRQERDEEMQAELDELEDEDIDDDYDDDEDEDEEDDLEGADYGDVIYDAQGIPRCPDCGAEMYYEAGEWRHAQAPLAVAPKVGRNDPCPCGSGKKYKHCHGKGL
jgi:hypothetical protein